MQILLQLSVVIFKYLIILSHPGQPESLLQALIAVKSTNPDLFLSVVLQQTSSRSSVSLLRFKPSAFLRFPVKENRSPVCFKPVSGERSREHLREMCEMFRPAHSCFFSSLYESQYTHAITQKYFVNRHIQSTLWATGEP